MTVCVCKYMCAFVGFVLEPMGKLCNIWMCIHVTQCNNKCEI